MNVTVQVSHCSVAVVSCWSDMRGVRWLAAADDRASWSMLRPLLVETTICSEVKLVHCLVHQTQFKTLT